jgi:hypothetical protein
MRWFHFHKTDLSDNLDTSNTKKKIKATSLKSRTFSQKKTTTRIINHLLPTSQHPDQKGLHSYHPEKWKLVFQTWSNSVVEYHIPGLGLGLDLRKWTHLHKSLQGPLLPGVATVSDDWLTNYLPSTPSIFIYMSY